jgi:transmembrane 9 superfamily protein 2/4
MLALALFISIVTTFYLPGVAPSDYIKGQQVSLHVNALNSVQKSLLPYEYYYDAFHFCRPPNAPISKSESLGSILFGDRLFSSHYQVYLF